MHMLEVSPTQGLCLPYTLEAGILRSHLEVQPAQDPATLMISNKASRGHFPCRALRLSTLLTQQLALFWPS